MARTVLFLEKLKRFNFIADELAVQWHKETEQQGYGYPFAQAFDEIARQIHEWRAKETVASAALERLEEKLIA